MYMYVYIYISRPSFLAQAFSPTRQAQHSHFARWRPRRVKRAHGVRRLGQRMPARDKARQSISIWQRNRQIRQPQPAANSAAVADSAIGSKRKLRALYRSARPSYTTITTTTMGQNSTPMEPEAQPNMLTPGLAKVFFATPQQFQRMSPDPRTHRSPPGLAEPPRTGMADHSSLVTCEDIRPQDDDVPNIYSPAPSTPKPSPMPLSPTCDGHTDVKADGSEVIPTTRPSLPFFSTTEFLFGSNLKVEQQQQPQPPMPSATNAYSRPSSTPTPREQDQLHAERHTIHATELGEELNHTKQPTPLVSIDSSSQPQKWSRRVNPNQRQEAVTLRPALPMPFPANYADVPADTQVFSEEETFSSSEEEDEYIIQAAAVPIYTIRRVRTDFPRLTRSQAAAIQNLINHARLRREHG